VQDDDAWQRMRGWLEIDALGGVRPWYFGCSYGTKTKQNSGQDWTNNSTNLCKTANFHSADAVGNRACAPCHRHRKTSRTTNTSQPIDCPARYNKNLAPVAPDSCHRGRPGLMPPWPANRRTKPAPVGLPARPTCLSCPAALPLQASPRVPRHAANRAYRGPASPSGQTRKGR